MQTTGWLTPRLVKIAVALAAALSLRSSVRRKR